MGGETPPPKPNEKSQVLHNESLAVYAKLQIPSQPEREEDFGTLCTSSEREKGDDLDMFFYNTLYFQGAEKKKNNLSSSS
jgi:hypothetical protein